MQHADVIVVGLGAMGSAAAYQLARRGVRVLGIDRHAPPHVHGSTHGDTRVTRQATAEGAAFVPLVIRSQQLWRELEAETGADLFTDCGVLMVGPSRPGGSMHGVDDWVAATTDLARRFGVEHEVLDGASARERAPLLAIEDDARALFEPGGGFVRPEAAVTAQLALAGRHGASILGDCEVLELRSTEAGVEVVTDAGTHAAGHVVLAAGAWVGDFLEDSTLRAYFAVTRQWLHWFELDPARAELATPDRCPVYMWTFGVEPDEHFYGFPAIDGVAGGMKVASERFDEAPADADAIHRGCLQGRHLGVTSRALRSVACRYTSTPDSNFVIDDHPELANVTLVSPCSGHGFKHSAAIGEALAERIVDGASRIDLDPFVLTRPTRGSLRPGER